jgi:hypothetical protein
MWLVKWHVSYRQRKRGHWISEDFFDNDLLREKFMQLVYAYEESMEKVSQYVCIFFQSMWHKYEVSLIIYLSNSFGVHQNGSGHACLLHRKNSSRWLQWRDVVIPDVPVSSPVLEAEPGIQAP